MDALALLADQERAGEKFPSGVADFQREEERSGHRLGHRAQPAQRNLGADEAEEEAGQGHGDPGAAPGHGSSLGFSFAGSGSVFQAKATVSNEAAGRG